MVKQNPIICPHCKKDTGYKAEDFMFYVAYSDVLCPHCNEVIIKSQKIEM